MGAQRPLRAGGLKAHPHSGSRSYAHCPLWVWPRAARCASCLPLPAAVQSRGLCSGIRSPDTGENGAANRPALGCGALVFRAAGGGGARNRHRPFAARPAVWREDPAAARQWAGISSGLPWRDCGGLCPRADLRAAHGGGNYQNGREPRPRSGDRGGWHRAAARGSAKPHRGRSARHGGPAACGLRDGRSRALGLYGLYLGHLRPAPRGHACASRDLGAADDGRGLVWSARERPDPARGRVQLDVYARHRASRSLEHRRDRADPASQRGASDDPLAAQAVRCDDLCRRTGGLPPNPQASREDRRAQTAPRPLGGRGDVAQPECCMARGQRHLGASGARHVGMLHLPLRRAGTARPDRHDWLAASGPQAGD